MRAEINPQVRDIAIDWLVRTQSGLMSAPDLEALRCWREASDEHEHAWQRVASLPLLQQPGANLLRDATARRALASAGPDMQKRRQLLKRLLVLGAVGTVAWQGAGSTPVRAALANHRTGTGERRQWTLVDGSSLWLNTASAVNLDFNDQVRRIQMIEGELALNVRAESRPLQLITPDAILQSRDAQLQVRHDRQGTQVTVVGGQVQVHSRGQPTSSSLEAGWQARVDRLGIGVPSRPDLLVAQAWLRGILPADRLRLDALVAELSRYRPGVLRCHEQVSGLRLTGSFSLDDTDAALTLVARTLPVRIERMTRYWVSIVPA
ncbi:DUF4880 domain-containing protein [Pseudomonas panacis]|uniref:FecR domain-containing protein n=1 Tax=Pseudomonas marginalis TaxID=298 RepID=UPI001473208B|nr:FecR domain-containing protein [Pseudomonas marginalis]NMZ94858.1 DUF4880 domain-containing protein [Pseudomonas marginalis]